MYSFATVATIAAGCGGFAAGGLTRGKTLQRRLAATKSAAIGEGGEHLRPLRRGGVGLRQTFAAGTPTASAVYDKLSVQIASTGHFHDSQLNCDFVLPTLADGQMERLIFAALVYKMNASLLVRVR